MSVVNNILLVLQNTLLMDT